MSSGLPYEGTPPPSSEAIMTEPSALDRPLEEYTEPSALDRPLEDYNPPRVVPEHVQSLMGRMSKGKVYLLEESPAAIVVDGGERLRRDPRLAQLAEQLDSQDPTSWLEAVSAGAPSPILHQVLYVQSDNIKHLSTSKVFSWATGLGASPMGIEWLNDTTLELLFPSSAAALLGLSLLAKAGFDPGEGDDPLLERSAHSFPLSLLPTESNEGVELLAPSTSSEEGGIRKKGRGGFAGGMSADYTTDSIAGAGEGEDKAKAWNLVAGIDPNARIAIRYATEADKTVRQQAKESEWYKRNGRTAGKEVASQSRNFGRGRERDYEDRYSFAGREEEGGGRDFAKRIGRERRGPYDRNTDRRGGGGGRRNQADLDAELDGLMQRRSGQGGDLDTDPRMEVEMDMDMDRSDRRRGGGGGRREGGQRRERRGVEDLDKELDDMFASRRE